MISSRAILSIFIAFWLSSAVKAENVIYSYDALGRLASASYNTGVIIIYSYDLNGNRTSQTVNINITQGTWGAFNWGAALWKTYPNLWGSFNWGAGTWQP